MSEEEAHLVGLLRRIAEQDERAYEELLHRLDYRIRRFVSNRLSNSADADEAIADTRFTIWKDAKSFAGLSSVSTWVCGIAANRVLMVLRTRRRHDDHDDIEEMSDALVSDVPDPQTLIEARQHLHVVRTCFGGLNSDQREALMMHVDFGMPYADIAKALRAPAQTIKTRIFHARQKLKDCVTQALKFIPPTKKRGQDNG